MKTTATNHNNQLLARHEVRERNNRPPAPSTDYQFRPAVKEARLTGRTTIPTRTQLRAFREMGQRLQAEESGETSLIEIAVFAIVIGLAAWPLVSLLIVLAQTANG